jgi:hypothetical protein
MAKYTEGYSTIKSYLQKNNLHYFTFSPNSEKPNKEIIRHLPPDTTVEVTSNSFGILRFNIINVRQIVATRKAPNGQTHVGPIPLFLVTLTRNKKIS